MKHAMTSNIGAGNWTPQESVLTIKQNQSGT